MDRPQTPVLLHERTSNPLDPNPLDSRLDDDEFAEVGGELALQRERLAARYAERSTKLVEGSQSAAAIRDLRTEVEDYINGYASELYLRYTEKEHLTPEEAAEKVDLFVAGETWRLLGAMGQQRLETAESHNRFVPKTMQGLYDKAVETWKSWDVPVGDGALVGRLRETGMWQHLEAKTSGTSRGSKLGRFALGAVSASVNGVENLVRYSGARKRAGAMLGLGILTGATAGTVLGAAGVGGASAFAAGLFARSMVRSGVSTSLNNAANLERRVAHDDARLKEGVNHLTDDAYSTAELLAYVDRETEKMLVANTVQLLGGVAAGVVGGLLGNTASRGVGWLAKYFSESAGSGGMVGVDAQQAMVSRWTGPRGPRFMMAEYGVGSETDAPNTSSETVVADDEPKTVVADDEPRAVVADDEPKTVVADDEPKTVVADDEPKTVVAKDAPKVGVVDGGTPPSPEVPITSETFVVEKGHGLIKETREWAKLKGYDISMAKAEDIYRIIREKYGATGIIDVHDVNMDGTAEASTVLNDTYDHRGDTRISAPGEANWRAGVEADIEKLLEADKQSKPLSLDTLKEEAVTPESPVAADVPDTATGTGTGTAVAAETADLAPASQSLKDRILGDDIARQSTARTDSGVSSVDADILTSLGANVTASGTGGTTPVDMTNVEVLRSLGANVDGTPPTTNLDRALNTTEVMSQKMTSSWYGLLDKLRITGALTIAPGQYGAFLNRVGPELAKLHYDNNVAVAYYDRLHHEWRMNASPDGRLLPDAVRLMADYAKRNNFALAS